jgi:peptidoglycan/xylan/chitin deacetylase (PgdA/CDA1 family)
VVPVVRALVLAAALATVPHSRPVPVLMYHAISVAPAEAPYRALYVAPADFAGQMRWLARHRYHAITLQHAYDYWTGSATLPPRSIVVSFDDGYLSQYTWAFKTLRALHWPAVLNLEVNFLRPVGGMRPWRVRNLIAAGWEIDAHTITHPDLTRVDDARLWHEVDGSRLDIRHEFHVPVDFFCYPSGRYDDRVVAAVRRAGFLGATTTNYGLAQPPDFFRLARVRVDAGDGVRGLATKLRNLAASAY